VQSNAGTGIIILVPIKISVNFESEIHSGYAEASLFMQILNTLQKLLLTKFNRKWFWLALILLSGFVLRYLFVFYFHPPEAYIYSDMQGYFDRAFHIHTGLKEDIYGSFYPPATHFVYSFFFAAKNPVLWMKWFNVILSSLTCMLIYFSTNRLFGNKAGMIALILSSFNYLFIDFSGYILSETLFTFSLALMFWLFLESILSDQIRTKRFYAIFAGFAIIASASVKSSILLFLPLFAIWWLFNIKKHRILYNLPFYALGFIPLLIILIIRFHNLTGEFGIVSTNGGFNFFQGRSHIKDLHCIDEERGTYYMFASPVAVQKNYSYNDTFHAGPYNSDFFYKKGIDLVKQNPWRSLKYSAQHITDLFITASIWPSFAIKEPFPALIRLFNILGFILIIIPAFFAGIIKFKYLWSGVGLLTLFPILVIILTSAIYYGDPRFRVPFDVFFIMLASLFYKDLMQLFQRKFKLPIARHELE
jgi:4-amino-4-deoxy-L-arabinose transferase-like glycosyltransferase